MIWLAWITWIALAGILVGAGWVWLRRTREPLAPLPIVLLTLGVYLLPRSAYLLVFDRPPLASADLSPSRQAELIAVTLALAVLGVLAFLAGHSAPSARRVASTVRFALPEPDYKRALWIGSAFGAIGLAALIYVVQSVGGIAYALAHQPELGDLLQGKLSVLQLTRLLLVPVALLLVDPERRRSRWWVWLIALLAVATLSTLGRRGLIVMAAAYPLGIHHLVVRRVPLRQMIPLSTIGGVALLWFGYVRPFGGQHLERAAVSFARQPMTMVHFAFNATGEFKIFDAATIVVRDVPSEMAPSYGTTFIRVPFMIIPRALWSEKPVTLGETIVARYLPQRRTGYPPTALGEFYVAGGPFAVLLGFFVLGWIGRCAWDWFQQRRSAGNATVYLALCFFFFDFTRVGDPSRTFWFLLLGVIFFTGAFCISSASLRPAARPGSTT